MLRRTIALLLCLFVVFSLAACGEVKEEPKEEPKAQEEPKTEPKEEPKEEPKAEEPVQEEKTYDIVVTDEVVFRITGVGKDEYMGYEVKCYIENNTDTELFFTWEDVSVNGFMNDPFWGVSVPAGKKQNTSITFYDLEKDGIEMIEELEFRLLVMPGANHEYDFENALVNDVFTVKLG